jgi:hypothetical protein
MEGQGEAVEWAVKMQRLPEEATLENRLRRGEVASETVQGLAQKVAQFHAVAEAGSRIAAFGRFDVVARNARENFEQSTAQVGVTVSSGVFGRLRALTDESLTRLRSCIEKRAAEGHPRDTQGDLRLEHVYLFPENPPPEDVVVIDCIEFSERFRFADPVADMAFLVMDLIRHGRRDLAQSFAEAYFEASGDALGRELLAFYTAYRAAVRGKVEGIKGAEQEVPEAERTAALAGARACWLLALGELEQPDRRPGLVLVGGLPGTGKSTLARGLAERAGFQLIRSDVIRKELAASRAATASPARFEDGIYTSEWTERTYAECLHRAEQLLFEGQRVLVDATFREDKRRERFLKAAVACGVPAVLIRCRAEPEVVQARLRSRQGDASDADWTVYVQAAAQWEEPSSSTRPFVQELPTEGNPEQSLAGAREVLRRLGLVR